jgi:hypothetical protein
VMVNIALRESPDCRDAGLMNLVTDLKRRLERAG